MGGKAGDTESFCLTPQPIATVVPTPTAELVQPGTPYVIHLCEPERRFILDWLGDHGVESIRVWNYRAVSTKSTQTAQPTPIATNALSPTATHTPTATATVSPGDYVVEPGASVPRRGVPAPTQPWPHDADH
jgi:hypothetical protein